MKLNDIICASLGVIFGGCAGILLTREHYKKFFQTKADQEIEEYRAYMEKKYGAAITFENWTKKQEERNSLVNASESDSKAPEDEDDKVYVDEEKMAYRAITEPYRGHIDYTKPDLNKLVQKYAEDDRDKHLSEREYPIEEDDVDETIRRIEDGVPRDFPYEISEDEYNDPRLDDYLEKHEILYFTDGEIADSQEEILDEAYKFLGETMDDANSRVDWDFIYIRNEKLGMDFQIENKHCGYEEYLQKKYGV